VNHAGWSDGSSVLDQPANSPANEIAACEVDESADAVNIETGDKEMPLELQIIRAAEFVRLGAQGHFDLSASKVALVKIAHACRKRGVDRALMDLRELQPGPTPVFSPADLVTLVNSFRRVGLSRQQRLAILYKTDPHRRARLFALISTLRGWSVRAFDNFEKAIAWLSSGVGDEEYHLRPPGEKAIAVRTSKPVPQPAALPVKLVKRAKKSNGPWKGPGRR
jgi:hypothetical protein